MTLLLEHLNFIIHHVNVRYILIMVLDWIMHLRFKSGTETCCFLLLRPSMQWHLLYQFLLELPYFLLGHQGLVVLTLCDCQCLRRSMTKLTQLIAILAKRFAETSGLDIRSTFYGSCLNVLRLTF